MEVLGTLTDEESRTWYDGWTPSVSGAAKQSSLSRTTARMSTSLGSRRWDDLNDADALTAAASAGPRGNGRSAKVETVR